jgi:hypothetical protein
MRARICTPSILDSGRETEFCKVHFDESLYVKFV